MSANSIDKKGIYPAMCMMELTKDKQLQTMAIHGPVSGAMVEILIRMYKDKCKHVIFGFDRYFKPEQGYELKDGLSITYLSNNEWKFGIMEYQHEPRIVKPVNWNDQFWIKALANELRQTIEFCKKNNLSV